MFESIDPKIVGYRIKEIRKKLGLSMSSFAERIDDKSKSGTVSNWETGKNLPNNERLKKIATLGGISIDELLYGDIETRIYNIITNEIDRKTKAPHYYIFYDNELEGKEIIRDAIQDLKVVAVRANWTDEDIARAFDKIAVEEFLRRPYNNKKAIEYTNLLLGDLSQEISNYFYKKNSNNEYELRNGLSLNLYDDLLAEISETIDRISLYTEDFHNQ